MHLPSGKVKHNPNSDMELGVFLTPPCDAVKHGWMLHRANGGCLPVINLILRSFQQYICFIIGQTSRTQKNGQSADWCGTFLPLWLKNDQCRVYVLNCFDFTTAFSHVYINIDHRSTLLYLAFSYQIM